MNLTAALLTSAARTTTTSSSDQQNLGGQYLHVVLDSTVIGTGSITVTIEGKDVASGKYYTILAGAAVVTNVTNVYKVGPALTAAANAVANDAVPAYWRVTVTANNANSATYSVGFSLV